MMTKRDIQIFKFINIFGKTYNEVLEKTFFSNIKSARNRITILKKQGFVNFWQTGLLSPRNAIVLSAEIKEFLHDEFDIKPKNVKLHNSTIYHNIIEQISFYHLSKLQTISKIERATIYKHSKIYHHIPDIILHLQNHKIFIEIETSKKNPKRYIEIFEQCQKDNILQIIYVVKSQKILENYSQSFPKFEKLFFITIDDLIKNITNDKMLNAKKQSDI